MRVRIRTMFFIAAVALFVFLCSGGGAFIFMSIGAGLALGGFEINKRSWTNLPRTKSMRRPLTGSVILAVLVTAAIGGGVGDNALSYINIGFGATGLALAGSLLIKHFGPEEWRGSN